MSYRVVFLLFLLTFSLVFSRVLFRGEVIFPHDNAFEAGCRHRRDDPFPSNRKFSDESNVFIPELANNLDKNRRGWLATWNPHVELGRPASQLSGLNRSYPLTNGLMLFITNPFALYTVLVLIAVGLTGIFLILFLRALGLIPVAALVAAIGLTLTTTVSYWTTFVMFLSPICWTVCLLWLLTEFLHSHSWLKALGLAFASYSLLLTGYPQLIILNAYLLGGFVFFRLRDRAKAGGSWFRPLAFLLGCAAAGAIASLPVYLDVWALARGSVRGAGLGDTFFLNVLPPVSQPADIVSFIATVIDWSWLGNAIDPAYPLSFNGLSFTIVFASLISLSFFLGRRTECLYWQIFLLACLAGTIFPQLYLFAVHHLGFGLSRIQVLAGGIIPGFVVSAYVVDALGRGKLSLSLGTLGGLLVPVAFLAVVAIFVWRTQRLEMMPIVMTAILVAALVGAIYLRRPALVVVLAIAGAFLFGRTLVLSRPLRTICLSSALLDKIKAKSNGSRFVIADPAINRPLPPNQEALFGLGSVNSYNSLLSRNYGRQVGKWSKNGIDETARKFKFVDSQLALSDKTFPLSDVGLFLSAHPLTSDLLQPVGAADHILLYRPRVATVKVLQTDRFRATNSRPLMITLPSAERQLPVRLEDNKSDYSRISVSDSAEDTLLFVSQQYFPTWRAFSGKRPLMVGLVNDFYQGIIVPPHTSEVELFHYPFAWWSWLPQAVFALLGILFVGRSVFHRVTARRPIEPEDIVIPGTRQLNPR